MKFEHFWTEDDFINGIRKGDEKAIKAVYKSYFPMIENFVRLNEGTVFEAKDLFQEGFMVLYRNLNNPVFTLQCKIKTYLYSVCKRIWLTELKRKSKSLNVNDNFDETIEFEESDFEEHAKNEQNLSLLEVSLNKLGEPCRSLLTDFYMNNLSMQDIAVKNGYTNAENAKNQKYKCLLRLKKIYFESPVFLNKM
jgi:RNA polymerase sigma factor (sigma-70 family)